MSIAFSMRLDVPMDRFLGEVGRALTDTHLLTQAEPVRNTRALDDFAALEPCDGDLSPRHLPVSRWNASVISFMRPGEREIRDNAVTVGHPLIDTCESFQ